MAICKLDRGVLIDCDREHVPGGLDYFLGIDKKVFVETSVTRDALGYVTYFETSSPTEKFYKIECEDDDRARVDDPTTDKFSSAFFRDITAVYSIDNTPKNRQFVDKLTNTRVVLIDKNKAGHYHITGSKGRGLTMNQVTESSSGAAPADQTRMLLNFKGSEPINWGRIRIWIQPNEWDSTAAYVAGDIVKYTTVGGGGAVVNYYRATASSTGEVPSGLLSWVEITEKESRDKATEDFILSITNP